MKEFCCEYMNYHANFRCDFHENPYACPDSMILFTEKSNDYGIIIHDGGSATITINFCPWCGATL